MLIPDCPEGGCLKATPGTVFQVFDKDGKCLSQVFYAANEDIEYTDSDGEEVDDERENFYHPFDMAKTV